MKLRTDDGWTIKTENGGIRVKHKKRNGGDAWFDPALFTGVELFRRIAFFIDLSDVMRERREGNPR